MKRVFLTLALGAVGLTGSLAGAQEAINPQEYKQVYLVGGRETNAAEAIVAAVKGESVLKCQSVQATISKSGTSLSVKNVKKPKGS